MLWLGMERVRRVMWRWNRKFLYLGNADMTKGYWIGRPLRSVFWAFVREYLRELDAEGGICLIMNWKPTINK